MAKPPKEAYELSDAGKRDLTQLIQKGLPLPEKYRISPMGKGLGAKWQHARF